MNGMLRRISRPRRRTSWKADHADMRRAAARRWGGFANRSIRRLREPPKVFLSIFETVMVRMSRRQTLARNRH